MIKGHQIGSYDLTHISFGDRHRVKTEITIEIKHDKEDSVRNGCGLWST